MKQNSSMRNNCDRQRQELLEYVRSHYSMCIAWWLSCFSFVYLWYSLFWHDFVVVFVGILLLFFFLFSAFSSYHRQARLLRPILLETAINSEQIYSHRAINLRVVTNNWIYCAGHTQCDSHYQIGNPILLFAAFFRRFMHRPLWRELWTEKNCRVFLKMNQTKASNDETKENSLCLCVSVCGCR